MVNWECEFNPSDTWIAQSVAQSVWQCFGTPTIWINNNSYIVLWANNTGNITAWSTTSTPPNISTPSNWVVL